MACVPPRITLNLDQIFSCQLTHQSAQLGQQATTLTRLEAKIERIERVLGTSGLHRRGLHNRGSVTSLCSIASSVLSIGHKEAWKEVYRYLHLNGITLTADIINAKKEELCKLFRTNSILELSSSGEFPDEEGVPAPQSPDGRSRPTVLWVRDYVAAQIGGPLHRAAFRDRADLVQELLDKGANIDARTGFLNYGGGFTALHLAAAEGHLEVVKVLLDRGASIVTTLFRITALHLAAESWDTEIEVVKLLLERGAPINAANTEGNTPLHYAAGYMKLILPGKPTQHNHHAKILTFLLESGARTDVKNIYRETPLDIARQLGWERGVKVLMEHIANNSEPVPEAY